MTTHRTRIDDVGARRGRAVLAGAILATVSTLVLATAPALADPASSPATGRGDGSTLVDGPGETRLRPLLDDVIAAGVPGALVRVQEGHQVRASASGVADIATGAALRPAARFKVGSVTKTFVATVVLQLVQERRLRLDEPVERRLPGVLVDGPSVTVRQLLNHTSGLFDYTQDAAVLAGIAEDRVFAPQELVGIAESHARTGPPGAAWAYSNTNYIVAGLLVEAVTQHRLGGELRRRIIEPLGLTHTSFPDATTGAPRDLAHGYVPADLVPTPDGRPLDVTDLNPSAAWAAGAMVSNSTDLARFYEALMGGELLSRGLLREMRTTVPQDPSDPDQFRYGLGIERVQDPCGVNWGHSGSIFGYQDMAYWNERTGRTVVLASTMFPLPVAADEALTRIAEVALCELTLGQRR